MGNFQFGVSARGGNSLLKLIVYLENQGKPETVYSFDGRYNRNTGKPMQFDDPKYWNIENAERYLKAHFADKFQSQSRLQRAMIADADYPRGTIHKMWCRQTGTWTDQETANSRAHQAHISSRLAETPHFSFRLALPMYAELGKPTTWKNFFTQAPSVGAALVELVGQYNNWRIEFPNARPQERGQIYGEKDGNFDTNSQNVPKPYWFETATATPRNYRTATHQATSVVKEYQDELDWAGEFAEMWSNIAA